LSNTTAAIRAAGGCVDTDNNATDFAAGAPTPRNTASPLNPCPPDQPPSVASTSPPNGAAGIALDANITVTFSEPVNVAGAWVAIPCANSGSPTATVSGGPTTFTLDPSPDFAASESCALKIVAAQVTDQDPLDPPDSMTADHTATFTALAPPTPIY